MNDWILMIHKERKHDLSPIVVRNQPTDGESVDLNGSKIIIEYLVLGKKKNIQNEEKEHCYWQI